MDRDLRIALGLSLAIIAGLVLSAAWIQLLPRTAGDRDCLYGHQQVNASASFDLLTGEHGGGFVVTTVCDRYAPLPPAPPFPGP